MSDSLNVDSRYRLSNRKTRAKFKKQRNVKGFCDGDVWNMDSYLLTLISCYARPSGGKHARLSD